MKVIVVGVDHSAGASAALVFAEEEARCAAQHCVSSTPGNTAISVTPGSKAGCRRSAATS